jgi:hypothetical protein
MTTTRTCLKCGQSYPATADYFQREHGRLGKTCKACLSAYMRERYARLHPGRYCTDCGAPVIGRVKHCPACSEWRYPQPTGLAIFREEMANEYTTTT